MTKRERAVQRLKKARPRNRLARGSAVGMTVLVLGAWIFGGFRVTDVTAPQRRANLARFLNDAKPQPLREGGGISDVIPWATNLLRDHGLEASVTTLAIAVAAIVLAGLGGLLFTLPAARNVSTPEPFLPGGVRPSWRRRWAWRGLVGVTRMVLVFLRAIPEYVWAFLFLAMVGPRAWPAVLALALHNLGILGKLGGEVVENVEPRIPSVLRGLGARRLQIAVFGLFPMVLPRFLLYFFYRWETCVREATILGMLGFSSLGYWIVDARARHNYDTMLFLVLLGSLLVLAGDLISALARGFVRRAS